MLQLSPPRDAPPPRLAALPPPRRLRVLLVEDRQADATLILHMLRGAGFAPEWRRVETEQDYLANLDPELDIILADYELPQFSGLEALRLVRERGLSIPFILVTGTAGEEAAVSALHAGADDYLLKDRLARLGRAVARSLEQRALRDEKQRAELELRDSQQRLLSQERAARAAAEAAVRMRDEFVGIASHELRTPITTIKCTVQLLQRALDRGDIEPALLNHRLSVVDTMSDRLNLLITDLLDVTRLRTGQLHLRPEPIDLARLLQEVVDEQRVQVGSQYPLSLKVLGVLPALSVDPYRMQQVLSNVLQNAIKYSPAGGDVAITVRAQGQGVLITVADRGIGLPPEELETIFEAFGRASNAQRQQLPGMGLGLYITRQIVEQHGGRIWMESPGEGSGTLASIWLPPDTATASGPVLRGAAEYEFDRHEVGFGIPDSAV
jgi:signal transduction histidine kinase